MRKRPVLEIEESPTGDEPVAPAHDRSHGDMHDRGGSSAHDVHAILA